MTATQILMLGTSAACLRAASALASWGFPVVRADDGADVDPRRVAPALVIADADVAQAAWRWRHAPLILLASIGFQDLPAVACAELLTAPLREELLLSAVQRALC